MTYFGHENNICVAACGNKLSEYQINLLCSAGATRILIAFDKEGETWKKQESYYNKLTDLCKKYRNKVKMGFIFDKNNLLNLKDSPFDKGKEIFLKLYNSSIWI